MEGLDIPEEVAMDILLRLPVKSLVRFRCLCKYWCSSFQTSHFITKHYLNNFNNNNLNLFVKRCHHDDMFHNRLLFTRSPVNIRHIDFTYSSYLSALSTEKEPKFEIIENIHSPFFKKSLENFEVYGPCDGLICLSEESGKVALWNPSTREFKIIPTSTVPRPPSVASTSYGGFGFGFDSTTNDYKLVRFVENVFDQDPLEWILQVELYSLKSDSWKEISFPHALPSNLKWSDCYINGFYYWRAMGSSGSLILSFDMANEKFTTFPLPNRSVNRSTHQLLLDFNGLLGVMVYPRRSNIAKPLDLWVMMNGSWTKQLRIEPIPGVETPLGFWKNGEIFLQSSNKELMLFDPATREVKNLGIAACRNEMQIIAYFESLVPINGRSEDDESITRQSAGEASSGHSRQRGN